MKQVLVRTDRCLGCKSCEMACSIAHSGSKNLFAAVLGNEQPVRRVKVENNAERSINLPVQCRQCREAKCVSACMTGAMHLDEDSGLVINNEEKCVGCWMCVMVCPYGTISVDEQQKVATKCDQCLSEGHDPACVKACPTKALKFVEVSEFDRALRKDLLSRLVSGEEA